MAGYLRHDGFGAARDRVVEAGKTGHETSLCGPLPSGGIDLRLMQGQEFRRTELHREADAATAKAEAWKAALLERGWRDL